MRMGHSRHMFLLGLLWMSQKLSCLLCTTCCVHDKRCPIERTIVMGVAFCHCLALFNLDRTSAASFDFWLNFFADFCCGFFGDFALFLFCGRVVWFLFVCCFVVVCIYVGAVLGPGLSSCLSSEDVFGNLFTCVRGVGQLVVFLALGLGCSVFFLSTETVFFFFLIPFVLH